MSKDEPKKRKSIKSSKSVMHDAQGAQHPRQMDISEFCEMPEAKIPASKYVKRRTKAEIELIKRQAEQAAAERLAHFNMMLEQNNPIYTFNYYAADVIPDHDILLYWLDKVDEREPEARKSYYKLIGKILQTADSMTIGELNENKPIRQYLNETTFAEDTPEAAELLQYINMRFIEDMSGYIADELKKDKYTAYLSEDITASHIYIEVINGAIEAREAQFLKVLEAISQNPTTAWQEVTNELQELAQATTEPTQIAPVTPKKLAPVQKVTSYSMPNAKAVNHYLAIQELLAHIDNDGQLSFYTPDGEEAAPLKVQTKNNKDVIDLVSLVYAGDLDGKAAKMKQYDQSIMNTVCSLTNAGNKVFLLEDVYKVLTQKSKATAAQLKKIETSLQKLSGTRIRLDVSEEIKAKLLTADNEIITNGIIEDSLLNYRTLTVITEKGTRKIAIEIISEPVLFSYSKLKRQIITVPIELLELQTRANEDIIAIRDYLLREINQIKIGYRNNPVINYENMLKAAGIDAAAISPTEKNRITEAISKQLEFWKDKKFIKAYKIKNGQRNKVVGIEIIF